MKESRSIVYRFLPEVFLRAPYYSFSGYDLSRLPEVLQEQAFRNAVFLASAGFYSLLEKKEFDFDRLTDKEKYTLSKYYNRMCFRATPFGSFSSFTLLHWGSGGQVRLAGADESVLHLLPDQEMLREMKNRADSDLPEMLIVNPMLYRFNDVLRYTKSSLDDRGKFNFSLQGIAAEKFNVKLFSFLASKKVSKEIVISWVMQHGECSAAEAGDYIGFLLDAGAIFAASQGGVIDQELIQDFPGLPGWKDFWRDNTKTTLSDGVSLSAMARDIARIGADSKLTIEEPFYAVLERPNNNGGPDSAEQEELSKAVHVLQLLSNAEQPADLSRFIRDFRSRFDQERVPLLLALDPDAGLHYGDMEPSMPDQDILENIPFPVPEEENRTLGWHVSQQFIFKLWIGDTLRDPWAPLQISEEDVIELENHKKVVVPLPQTQALMYRSTGEHLIIESSGGVTAASLIGRFSCFSDPVHQFCRELAEMETASNPEVVFADIAQQSDSHVDNINRRKPIYPHEIPLNVFPSQPAEKLALPSELMLSLKGDELILESSKFNKRVIPRLATAYNFRNNHSPVFRLLCDLQFQGVQAGLSFSLENFFPGLGFYPRVCYGRVILCLAKWNFKESDLAPLTVGDNTDPFKTLNGFRKKYHLPRHITIGATDQQLVFDLANMTEARFFLQCIHGLKRITIQEYLWPDRSVLSGKKPLAGQMIAFLAHENNVYQPLKNESTTVYDEKQRDFLMGSNWLYLKIFCIPRASDEILSQVIFPFIKGQKKRIKKWFFIRYSEKGYHLRLRIQAEEHDLGAILVALRKKIESSGHDKLIRDFQGDTYRREIERYGADLISHVEELFYAGSHVAVVALTLKGNNSFQLNEFELALLTAYRMINSFFTSPVDALDYLGKVTNQFMAEFRADKLLKVAMDEKYRENKLLIADLLESKGFSKHLSRLLKQMSVLNGLTGSFSKDKRMELLADLVHMQLNRTFSVRQRQQELLVYYCLQKYNASLSAREKSSV
ncbi:lantibiotic dehydratase [Pedobacter sp. ISL-68]|uniref:lantibiotic dehydratase n=1 Tax=unclassified Pedobacter TaxID=2628915 RepID=UPI001BEC7A27|nr:MULTISPECIES: lantibiotic dehydratase [unclassified Pedobacter]MBT2560721.1 lantibiotic dehydratase [Pedobacter sp. ISL-64]MBT2590100.1 lantibiotic dehydratase [Pedobacter sp. ISL-68]